MTSSDRVGESKLNTLQAGAVGSLMAEFLDTKEKLTLSRCNRHWKEVIDDPSSWGESVTLPAGALSMSSTRLELILNRTQLRSLTIRATEKPPDGKQERELKFAEMVGFVDRLCSLAKDTDSKFRPTNLCVMIQPYVTDYACSRLLLNSVPYWAKEVQVLLVQSGNVPICLNAADDKGRVMKLHTLEADGLLGSTRSLDHLIPTLRVLRLNRIHLGFLDDVAFAISKLHLTTLDMDLRRFDQQTIQRFYNRLTEPLTDTVTSIREAGRQDFTIFKNFTNIECVSISQLSEFKSAVETFPKLKRVILFPKTFDETLIEEFVRIASSRIGDAIPIDMELMHDASASSFRSLCVTHLMRVAGVYKVSCTTEDGFLYTVRPDRPDRSMQMSK